MREDCNLAERKNGAARASRKADRLFILELATALSVSERLVKRDRCGDWNIVARRGHVATDGVSFYAYVRVRSPRRWKGAKRTLGFLCATQDGDDEGIFILREMPTAEQAATIRKVLGMRKAPVLTDEQRASRRLNLAPKSRAVSSDFIDVVGAPATNPADEPQMQINKLTAKSRPGLKAPNA
jgi:hypothetical protein